MNCTDLELYEHMICVQIMGLFQHCGGQFGRSSSIYLNVNKLNEPEYGSQARENIRSIQTYYLKNINPPPFAHNSIMMIGIPQELFGYTIEFSDKNTFKLNSNFKTIDDLYEHFDYYSRFDVKVMENRTICIEYLFDRIKQMSSKINKYNLFNLFEQPRFKEILDSRKERIPIIQLQPSVRPKIPPRPVLIKSPEKSPTENEKVLLLIEKIKLENRIKKLEEQIKKQ